MGSVEDVVFAKVGNKGYVAGIGERAVREFLMDAYRDIGEQDVSIVLSDQLPPEYAGCARYVRETSDWKQAGTFVLLRNFQDQEMQ